MDSKDEAGESNEPAKPEVADHCKPHASVDRAETGDGGGDDAVIELELARRTERSARLTMVATVAIALGTGALALATFHLASSTVDVAGQTKLVADRTKDLAEATSKLVDLARDQGADTKSAIAAASRQAAAAEDANKVSRDPGVSVSSITMGMPTANAKYKASFGVFAYGRTPAFHVQGQAMLLILSEPQLPRPLDRCVFCGDGALFPANGFQGSGLNFTTNVIELTPQIMSDIKEKRKTLFMIGRIDYSDQSKSQRYITICNLYKIDDNESGPCPVGNDAD